MGNGASLHDSRREMRWQQVFFVHSLVMSACVLLLIFLLSFKQRLSEIDEETAYCL